MLVFDTTCPSHFALAERLDVLHDLVLDDTCYTTDVVRDELRRGLSTRPALQDALDADWLLPAQLDTVEDLQCFAKWSQRIGGEPRNLGESSVFAVVERQGGIAISDDRDAVRVGRAYGLPVHGTVWLLARACGDGKVTEVSAGNLIECLRDTGMRLPCTGRDFGAFSRRHGLL